MKPYEQIARSGKAFHLKLAEAALHAYGLHGACLTCLSDAGHVIYKVSVPSSDGPLYHPYLGRIDGRQFVLRIESAAYRPTANTYAELVLLAALLRDTELDMPEPVPACDGALVPDLWVDGIEQPQQCVLFRWATSPFPEAALRRAAQWQAN